MTRTYDNTTPLWVIEEQNRIDKYIEEQNSRRITQEYAKALQAELTQAMASIMR